MKLLPSSFHSIILTLRYSRRDETATKFISFYHTYTTILSSRCNCYQVHFILSYLHYDTLFQMKLLPSSSHSIKRLMQLKPKCKTCLSPVAWLLVSPIYEMST